MGTRGFLGFVVDGTEKITYNHAASHPEDLGLTVLGWARGIHDLPVVADLARRLRMVDGAGTPTTGEVNRLADFIGGNAAEILRAGVACDAAGWPLEPRCRWGYLVDFDRGQLEVYTAGPVEVVDGKIRSLPRDDTNRFTTRAIDGHSHYHYPELVASWPLGGLPDDATFLYACNGAPVGLRPDEAGFVPSDFVTSHLLLLDHAVRMLRLEISWSRQDLRGIADAVQLAVTGLRDALQPGAAVPDGA